jgi:DHA2 family methylenomycin A resistance protein-like MFS transporter
MAPGRRYGTQLALGLLLPGFGVSLSLPVVSRVVPAAPDGYAGTAGGLFNAAAQASVTAGVAATGGRVRRLSRLVRPSPR